MNSLKLIRLGLAACVGLASLTASAAPRNVVLYLTDDQGLDAGCYGNTVLRTPHLDKLAADGTRFNSAFCTTASCSPSRSVILSGQHNHANGQYGLAHYNFTTKLSIRTVPAVLSDAGYRTAIIGKAHIAPDTVYPFQVTLRGNQGGARNPVSMAEICREFITDKSKPFFLYFCPVDPHRGAVDATQPFKPDTFGNIQTYEGVNEVVYDPKEVIVPPFLPDTPETRAELAHYYQSVSRVDQGLGRLIEILKETGQYDDTLIIYTSDNGIAFPGAKTTLYEPGMRLPMVVRSPDQKTRGGVCDAMVSFVDLAPTIYEFCGVKFEATPAGSQPRSNRPPGKNALPLVHGRSFLSVIEQTSPTGWDEVYGSHTFHEVTMYYPMRVIRTPQYKYILNLAHPLPFPFAKDLHESAAWQGALSRNSVTFGNRSVKALVHRPRHELYDLSADPDELKNLADDPRHAKVLEDLQARLRRFQERTGDLWLVKYDRE